MPCKGCRIITHPKLAADVLPLEAVRVYLCNALIPQHPVDRMIHLRDAEKVAGQWPALQGALRQLRGQCEAVRAARRAGAPAPKLDWDGVLVELARVTAEAEAPPVEKPCGT